jgi:hypothetical protein
MRLRPCPVHLCNKRRLPRHFMCRECWSALPHHLRTRIQEEIDNCRLARIAHSDELFALRDSAINHLSARNRRRFEKPASQQQLHLLPI